MLKTDDISVSMFDANKFREEASKITKLISKYIIDNVKLNEISRPGLCYGIMQVAAMVAEKSGCNQELFMLMAKYAYEAESLNQIPLTKFRRKAKTKRRSY